MQLEKALEIALVLGRVKVVHALEGFRKKRAAGGFKPKKRIPGGGKNAIAREDAEDESSRQPGRRPRLMVSFISYLPSSLL
jgi:hypothetical protein